MLKERMANIGEGSRGVSAGESKKQVYIVGTVHVSKESMRRVDDAIRTHLPDIVCIELDLQRFRAMQADRWESQRMGEGKPTQVREGGQFRYSKGYESGSGESGVATHERQTRIGEMLTLPGMLRWLQQKVGEEFGIMPGSEMYSAVETAKKYNIGIALIDRPVQITIARVWSGMSFGEKVRLFGSLGIAGSYFVLKPVLGRKSHSFMNMLGEGKTIDVSKLDRGEGIADLMEMLKEQFPSIYRALVIERDSFMAGAVFQLLQKRAERVVVVVGAGHVSGMEKSLKDMGVDVRVIW
jgi:pheromone shutdown protein TraB